MNDLNLQIGTEIASNLPSSSHSCSTAQIEPKTLGELLNRVGRNPPNFRMLRTTATHLSDYLDTPIGDLSINSISDTKEGFRPFLASRKYAENSIRTYVNHSKILIQHARTLGWKPTDDLPQEWQSVFELAKCQRCAEVVRFVALRKRPTEVTVEDVDGWIVKSLEKGRNRNNTVKKKNRFWRILRDSGLTNQNLLCFARERRYGIRIVDLPSPLKGELIELLRWKQASFQFGRPKDERHRPVTAKLLESLICKIYGFAVNICGEHDITSFAGLIQKHIVSGWVEWSLNERRANGQGLKNQLRLIPGALRHHPSLKSIPIDWFKDLLDSIPVEEESEMKRRKAEKYVEYSAVANIPAMIRRERKRFSCPSEAVMEELLMRWLVTLPWRQRNIRECRISGSEPNLFKAPIPPFSDLDKPDRVKREEAINPAAEFWQFRFSPAETKTHKGVHALLPRQLIDLLEEYLKDHRPLLIESPGTNTLFLSKSGRPMSSLQVIELVSKLTLKHTGRRITPHPFRDIVAYTWLKEHPQDFLTLSKLLWHSDIKTTIAIYGSRFNESSGVVAMETWLEQRETSSRSAPAEVSIDSLRHLGSSFRSGLVALAARRGT